MGHALNIDNQFCYERGKGSFKICKERRWSLATKAKFLTSSIKKRNGSACTSLQHIYWIYGCDNSLQIRLIKIKHVNYKFVYKKLFEPKWFWGSCPFTSSKFPFLS